MPRVFIYRCYTPENNKDPVINKMRTVLQQEGYYSKKRRNVLHQLSGVAVSTLEGWFEGDTRSPRHETVAAAMAAIGYEEKFVKVRDINEDRELQAAREWFEQQKELRAKRHFGRKMNNESKRGRKQRTLAMPSAR